MKTVFALANGRSGTRFLAGLLRANLRDAFVVHEPYFDRGNPTLFGRCIEDRTRGDDTELLALVARKRRRIERLRRAVYVETSHAFLKSWSHLAVKSMPGLRVVHLIRDPLKTARSEANREIFLNTIRFPRRRYRAATGGSRYRWSLTGDEEIYRPLGHLRLNRFAKYFIQWIEVENRAMAFRDQHPGTPCAVLHVPTQLNDPVEVGRAIDELGLARSGDAIRIAGHRNRTPMFATRVSDEDEHTARLVWSKLPAPLLRIFEHDPYRDQSWRQLLD